MATNSRAVWRRARWLCALDELLDERGVGPRLEGTNADVDEAHRRPGVVRCDEGRSRLRARGVRSPS